MDDIHADMTPAELNRLGARLANDVSRLGKIVAEYEINCKSKERRYKQTFAAAVVIRKDQGTPTIVKALAEIAPEVIAAADELEQAEALLIMGKAELDGADKQQQMVKQMIALRVQELRTFRG